MAGIPGLDVTEISDSRALTDPKIPNWTAGQPPPPPGPSTALIDPKRPNWTILDAGARQPFDFEAQRPQPSPAQSTAWRSLRAGAANLGELPGAIKNAGVAVGNGINAGANGIRNVGQFAAKTALNNSNGIISGIAATADHGNAYFDPNITTGGKLRMAGTDATRALGSGVGTLFGAGVGSAALPVAGTVTGGIVGGGLGERAGHWLGNKVFGGDDVLSQAGYDPNRTLMSTAADLFNGRGSDAFGVSSKNGVLPQDNFVSRWAPTAKPPVAGPQAPTAPPVVPPGGGMPASNAPAPNEILRNGNAFSGTNVREGFSYVNPDGSKLGSNPPLSNGIGIGVDGYMRQLENLRALPGPEQGGAGGFAGGVLGDSLRTSGIDPNWMAKHQAGLSSSPLDRRQMMSQASAEAIAARGQAGETQRAAMRERGDMARAQLGNSTTLRGQDLSARTAAEGHQVQREGQGMQYRLGSDEHAVQREGHQLTAQSALARLRQEQYHWGVEQEGKDTDRRAAATKALHEEISGMIPPVKVDGKDTPDLTNAARYATGLNAMVSNRQRQLQQHLQQNPADKEAQAALESLQKHGMNSLSPETKARYIAGMHLTDVISNTATPGWTPWGTRAIASDEPVTRLMKNKDGNYVTNRRGVNGETEVIPARYIEKEGSTLGMGGRASNRFKSLIQ